MQTIITVTTAVQSLASKADGAGWMALRVAVVGWCVAAAVRDALLPARPRVQRRQDLRHARDG